MHEPELFGVRVLVPLVAPVLAERPYGLDQHLRRSGAARQVGCGSHSAYQEVIGVFATSVQQADCAVVFAAPQRAVARLASGLADQRKE